MTVNIKFLGVFKKTVGRDSISLPIKAPKKLREVIMEITKSSPAFERVLIDPELHDPRPNAIILVNGKEISVLDGLETRLKDGDNVTLIPVTHGG